MDEKNKKSFSSNREDLFSLNFPPKLSRLKQKLNVWTQRDLTPIGRNLIFKTFAVSQLVFLFQVLPNPPKWFISELNSILYDFIWRGNPDKVKRSTIINPLNLGGLKVIHMESFISGLKISWISRYLDSNSGVWKLFFDYYLEEFGKELLFCCNCKPEDIYIRNTFISNVCKAWLGLSYKTANENYMNEILWNNSSIKINNSIVCYNFMHIKGIR